jgi:hypothetical protein
LIFNIFSNKLNNDFIKKNNRLKKIKDTLGTLIDLNFILNYRMLKT